MIIRIEIMPTSLALYGRDSAPAPIALWNSTSEPVRSESAFVGPNILMNELSTLLVVKSLSGDSQLMDCKLW